MALELNAVGLARTARALATSLARLISHVTLCLYAGLDIEVKKVMALQTNATLARDWLLQMGRGAQANGITIQYCMAWVRHLLQSLESPAVTNSRASNDYHPASLALNQWAIGVTSILLDALGLRPSKDNYQSKVSEPGNAKMSGASHARPRDRTVLRDIAV